MEYRNSYISPLGRILLTADEIGLTGLAFEGQKNAVQGLIRESEEKETTLFSGVKKWLDIYFSGVEPDFQIPIHLEGTDFQMFVWEMLCTIPYGETTTYAQSQSRSHMTEGFQRCRVRRLEMLSDATLCR